MNFFKYSFFDSKQNLIFLLISLAVLFLYLCPYFFLGKDVTINQWDDLDSNVVWIKSIVSSGSYFGPLDSNIPYFAGGYNRNISYSDFSIYPLVFSIFGDFAGYVVIKILVHLVAFFGMYKFLRNYYAIKNDEEFIIITSLCFALLPFVPVYGLSIAGIPIALNTFLNFRNKNYSSIDWFVLLILCFFGIFILSFLFVVIIFFGVLVYDLITQKKVNISLASSLFIFSLLFIIFEYRLFYYSFTLDIDTIRIGNDMYSATHLSKITELKTNLKNLIIGGTSHTPSFHYPFIFLVTLFAFNSIIVKQIDFLTRKKVFFTLLIIFSLSLISILLRSNLISFSNLLVKFNFSRFYFLLPTFWYVLFFLALINIKNNIKFGKFLARFFVFIQILILFSKSNAIQGYFDNSNFISYNKFYAVDLFNEIKKEIDQPLDSFKVGSIGIEPMVAQYNGFYTIDGYITDYPISYKNNFRKIIAKELEKSVHWKNYFDSWGARCYLFVSELEHIGQNHNLHYHSIPKGFQIRNLDLDINAFKSLGGKYIISNVNILNHNENNLMFVNKFDSENSVYRLHLYKVR